MITAEKLEKAKNGDEFAYRQLCGELADKLYAVALLTLGQADDAEAAVSGAFQDGYPSIARIKDGAHLQAWLSRELTKHLVAKIKEYRALGFFPAVDAPEAFSGMSGLDRIVCALGLAFGYGAYEISVITGLSAENAEKKLADTKKRLGESREDVLRQIESCKAPDSLKAEATPLPIKELPEKMEELPEKAEKLSEKAEKLPENMQFPEKKKQEIDARTFIGVISAQKIKGREFLQLMGNTRISNSVYREIEQNPNLTKGRLIELLESSPLTSEDYYKLLSAVKQRGELIARKEEAKKKAAEQARPVEKSGPFTPALSGAALDGISGGETPDLTENFGNDGIFDEDIAGASREKYKGKEFFIDDDVYYKGVNNGKLAFCAVCAVLLLGASFAVRFFTTGALLPAHAAEAKEQEAVAEIVEIASDEELLAAMGQMKSRVQRNSLDYYRSSALPYTETLSADFCETEEMLYIRTDGGIRAVKLDDDADGFEAQLAVSDGLIGFTAADGRFYAVYGSSDESGVTVEIYDGELNLLGDYRQDGRYVNMRTDGGSFTLITSLPPEPNRANLPAYEPDGEKKFLGYGDFEIAEGAVCSGIAVIGTVSGSETRVSAVLGGYEAYARIDGDRITLLLPDWNTTHVRTYRVIGAALELISSETLKGECFGAECFDADGGRAVTCDTAEGHILAMKKSGGEYAVSEGFGTDERLSGVSFSDDRVYVITESEGQSKLYCADTSGEAPLPAEADTGAVYSEKLAAFGENLIGLSAQADENGARTGLRLSVYGYDGGLTLLRSAEITVDDKTQAQYARYLSGDAEHAPFRIAVNGDATLAAVSCVYFDGVSEVERFICFRDDGVTLQKAADRLLYDIRSEYRYCAIRGNILYAVTDSEVYKIDIMP